jgi:hypothetical protein
MEAMLPGSARKRLTSATPANTLAEGHKKSPAGAGLSVPQVSMTRWIAVSSGRTRAKVHCGKSPLSRLGESRLHEH